VTVVEETIRYIDQLHQMLAERIQADDIRKFSLLRLFNFVQAHPELY